MSTEYNGWSNYETWCVNLWLTNDEGSQNMLTEWAQECYDGVEEDRYSTKIENATHKLAERIETFLSDDEMFCDMGNGIFSDLLTHALGMVDYHEIADGLLEDVEKE